MLRILFFAPFVVLCLLSLSCTKQDLVRPPVQPIPVRPGPQPVTPLSAPHIDTVYEENPGTENVLLYLTGKQFDIAAIVYIDGQGYQNFGERKASGNTFPQNEYALYNGENLILPTPGGLHVIQIKEGTLMSNAYPFVFNPRLLSEQKSVRGGQIFELRGYNLGNRTLPSTLNVYDVTDNQHTLLGSPAVSSWSTYQILMVMPAYTFLTSPFGQGQRSLQFEVTVAGKKSTVTYPYQP